MKALQDWAEHAPAPYDKTRLAREMEDFDAALAGMEDRQAAKLLGGASVRHLIASLFGNSPFLGRIVRLHIGWLAPDRDGRSHRRLAA